MEKTLKEHLLNRQRDIQERLNWAEYSDDFLVIKQESMVMLQQIEHTLKRMADGRFGRCEKCGGEIEEKRLKVMPTALRCINCGSKKG